MESTGFTKTAAAAAGVAFIVLALAPPFVSGIELLDDASAQNVALTEDSSRIIWSGWLGFVAAFAFVVFGTGVVQRLVGEGDRHLRMIAGAGTVIGAGALASGAGIILVAGLRGEELAEAGTAPTDTYAAAMLDTGIFLYVIVAVVGYALLTFAVGLSALGSASVPNWFAALSLVFAAGLMVPFGVAFFVLLAFPIWILIAALAPLRSEQPALDTQLTPSTV